MHHDHDTDGSGREGPTVLPRQSSGASLCLKLYAKHFAEVLPKTMGCCTLQQHAQAACVGWGVVLGERRGVNKLVT